MTNVEILDTFLEKHGITRKKGESIRLVLPWYIMDIVYDIYKKNVKDFDIKGKTQFLNKYRNAWKKAFDSFNDDFMDCFNIVQQDEIGDRISDFQQYIDNNLNILYISILDVYERMEADKDAVWQRTASYCFLVELLCSYSEKIWKDIVAPSLGHQILFDGKKFTRYRSKIQDPSVREWLRSVSKNMEAVNFAARKFSEVFYSPKGMIEVRKINVININGDAFYNRVLLYSNETRAQGIDKTNI